MLKSTKNWRLHLSALSLAICAAYIAIPSDVAYAQTATPTSSPATHSASQNTALTAAQIDELVERARKTFDVPGIAVLVVKDNKIVHNKGYGVRSLKTGAPMDEHTLVGIASNSKAFTGAALGMLVEQKKLNWNDKVRSIIPEFKLFDSYASEEFTIADLLVHRSGLGLGAGDLMLFPNGADFTVADVIHNMRYLKPVSSFRSKFDYDNNLYVIAGEVIKRVSGLSWEDFIEKNMLQPMGMKQSTATYSRVKGRANVADAHAYEGDKLRVIANPGMAEISNAAGGMVSSTTEMSQWILTLLNKGRMSNGQTLFSEKTLHELWTPQTLMGVPPNPGPYGTHFSAYALGWFVSDVKGYKQVTHTGGLPGMVTQVTLLPELNLGIVVLTNQEQGAAFGAITASIKDAYLGMPVKDHVADANERVQKAKERAQKIESEVWDKVKAQLGKAPPAYIDATAIAGKYNDAWFGDVDVVNESGKVIWKSKRSPALYGEMEYFQANTWVVKWKDRSFHADAFVTFQLNHDGKVSSMSMKAISPLTDFSFDFHDLDLRKR